LDDGDTEKALAYYLAAAELGWGAVIAALVRMLVEGEGCEKDLRQAVIWSAQGTDDYAVGMFWGILGDAVQAENEGRLDCDFDQLCYSIGWGLYWYLYNESAYHDDRFLNLCLDYYCSCVELQQKSMFTFLWCWNRTVGVKDIGRIIGKMVWEGREDNLVKRLEIIEEEPEQKRIKK
jgi:hypothetical protein